MDRHLTRHRLTTYRIAQCSSGLIIAVRVFLAPTRPGIIACVLVATLLLGDIVRRIGGDLAGAISLPLISFSPQLIGMSGWQTIQFLCLVSLVWLLVTRDWTRGRDQIAYGVALGVVIALGSLGGVSFLALSPVITFAWIVRRYVPADALRPYRTLWQECSRTSLGLTFITCIALFSLSWFLSGMLGTGADPTTYFLKAGNLFVQSLGFRTALTGFSALVLLGSCVSLWWLWISLESGNGVVFSLTAIPLTHLAVGSLQLIPEQSYAAETQPILLANLIAFVGLWLRGRANKRVLDSTRN